MSDETPQKTISEQMYDLIQQKKFCFYCGEVDPNVGCTNTEREQCSIGLPKAPTNQG